MSLNWELKHIKDWEKNCFYKSPEDRPMDDVKAGDEVMRPITWTLLMLTMNIGLGHWTEANINEVFVRVRSYEKMMGPMMRRPKDLSGAVAHGVISEDSFSGDYISRAEIERHIGLRTNVRDTSKTEWRKHFDEIVRRDVGRES